MFLFWDPKSFRFWIESDNAQFFLIFLVYIRHHSDFFLFWDPTSFRFFFRIWQCSVFLIFIIQIQNSFLFSVMVFPFLKRERMNMEREEFKIRICFPFYFSTFVIIFIDTRPPRLISHESCLRMLCCAYMNDSCRTYMNESYRTYMHESCRTRWMSHVAHIWMSHVAHIWMRHVAHI